MAKQKMEYVEWQTVSRSIDKTREREERFPRSVLGRFGTRLINRNAIRRGTDFAEIHSMANEFINGVFDGASDAKPKHLLLYTTGVEYATVVLIRAWQLWHERSFNVSCGLSIMSWDERNEGWRETVWYGERAE